MAFRRSLNSPSNGGIGVSPVQAQAKACGYKKLLFECKSLSDHPGFAGGSGHSLIWRSRWGKGISMPCSLKASKMALFSSWVAGVRSLGILRCTQTVKSRELSP